MANRDAENERQWVQRAQRGDQEAFLELVGLYERKLFYFIRRFERNADRASDILQEVWLAAWRTIGTLQTLEAFSVWIYRIAHGKVVSSIRRERRHYRLEEEPHHPSPQPDGAIDAADLVHFALGKLSVDHRAVMTLRFLEGMQIAEIADVVGCSEGTVKSRLHAAKGYLNRIIKEQYHDQPR